MTIWSLSDPHLAFGNPQKTMEVFGPKWQDYPDKIAENWKRSVGPDDLVIVAGDISWARGEKEALPDLMFLDTLPGQKLLIRGNHDYWWPSASKLRALVPPTIHFIQNSAFTWEGTTFGGSRLWDTNEYAFDALIDFVDNPLASKKGKQTPEESEKIFARELERLKRSLEQLDSRANRRIALTHYPPIGADLRPSRASAILEHFGVEICVFGHLHNVRPGTLPFGKARGVQYILTSADYLGFAPIKIVE